MKISSCQGGERYRARREDKRHTLVKCHVAELEVEGSAMDEDGRRRVVDVQKTGKKIGGVVGKSWQ